MVPCFADCDASCALAVYLISVSAKVFEQWHKFVCISASMLRLADLAPTTQPSVTMMLTCFST